MQCLQDPDPPHFAEVEWGDRWLLGLELGELGGIPVERNTSTDSI
jgi:hypothetical protein